MASSSDGFADTRGGAGDEGPIAVVLLEVAGREKVEEDDLNDLMKEHCAETENAEEEG